jgi:hypothetical protein
VDAAAWSDGRMIAEHLYDIDIDLGDLAAGQVSSRTSRPERSLG